MKSPAPDEIRTLIEYHKISQKKAAEISLVSYATMKRYLSGTGTMHPFIFMEFKRRISKY